MNKTSRRGVLIARANIQLAVFVPAALFAVLEPPTGANASVVCPPGPLESIEGAGSDFLDGPVVRVDGVLVVTLVSSGCKKAY